MTGKVTPLPSDQPGLYRFLIETGMAGKWELILSAKVPDETDTISGVITFDAGYLAMPDGPGLRRDDLRGAERRSNQLIRP